MIKYHKSFVYLPDPTRSRPNIPESHRKLAAQSPPMPLPLHCKPWMDEQLLGWTFYYGYLTSIKLIGLPDGKVEVENMERLQTESKVDDIFRTNFFGGYVGISATGYSISTPPGIVSLMMPATNPPSELITLPAILETDWYPRELVALFQAPGVGEQVSIQYGDELVRILPIPRIDEEEGLEQMTDEEAAELLARREIYAEDERTAKGQMTQSGGRLKRVYPRWSRKYGEKLKAETTDEVS